MVTMVDSDGKRVSEFVGNGNVLCRQIHLALPDITPHFIT